MKNIFTLKQIFTFIIYTIVSNFAFSIFITAQPSGGPYGPISKKYNLPEANNIYYVSPDGIKNASGADLNNPTTLKSAISRVETGDAIILRGGIYRTGDLKFNQGITIQPYLDEKPILKGTKIAENGIAINGDIWRIPWDRFFPSRPLDWWRRDREGDKTPLHRFNNDMVFVDGKFLQSAGWQGEVDENSYYIDYDNKQVYVGVDPAKHLVEITAYSGALIRTTSEVHGKKGDKIGPIIKGITFTQYAWRGIEIEGKRSFGPTDEPTDEPLGPSDPSTYGKEVIGTALENVTITYCSRVAGYFRGDSLTIRNSLFSDTSTEGVYVIGSSDVLLEGNIFQRNNIENLTGYYPSAVKIFNQSYRVTCRNNLVLDNPNSNGIWYDVGNVDGVFINNWVQNSMTGFFFEISKGAVCAGNVFVNCGYGIYVLNSSDVEVMNNTLINSTATFRRDNRGADGDHFGWHVTTGPDVDEREGHLFVGNILAVDDNFKDPLLQFIQPADLCEKLNQPQITRLDGNTYIHSNKNQNNMIKWSPIETENCTKDIQELEDLQRINPNFEINGNVLRADLNSVFMSPDLNNFELIKSVKKSNLVIPLSDKLKQILNWEKEEFSEPGAYPRKP